MPFSPGDPASAHQAVDVVSTPDMTISQFFGRVASDDPHLSACLVSVRVPFEEAFGTLEFDEYVFVTAGLLAVAELHDVDRL